MRSFGWLPCFCPPFSVDSALIVSTWGSSGPASSDSHVRCIRYLVVDRPNHIIMAAGSARDAQGKRVVQNVARSLHHVFRSSAHRPLPWSVFSAKVG